MQIFMAVIQIVISSVFVIWLPFASIHLYLALYGMEHYERGKPHHAELYLCTEVLICALCSYYFGMEFGAIVFVIQHLGVLGECFAWVMRIPLWKRSFLKHSKNDWEWITYAETFDTYIKYLPHYLISAIALFLLSVFLVDSKYLYNVVSDNRRILVTLAVVAEVSFFIRHDVKQRIKSKTFPETE